MQQQLTKPIPSSWNAFRVLFRADLTVLWRQRRTVFMSIIVPVIFLFAWKSLIPKFGADTVLAICIAIGLPAMGLMGYSISLARDRERGVFQRLRAAPIPTWVIMTSRIAVQLVAIVAMVVVTCLFAYFVDKITIGIGSAILLIIGAAIGGLAFIALGQAIVAFVLGSDAVSAATRLIYFPIAIVGAIGQIGLFGSQVEEIVTYSPLGTLKTMLVAAMQPSTIFTTGVLAAAGITILYGVFFAFIGIRWFRWSVN